MKKKATTEVPINDVIAQRWSPRAFDPNYIIEDDSIKSLFEAARWAPSCYGDQPWQFILFNKKDATSWTRALNCLSIGNQNWAMDASILIVVCANKNFNHNNEPNQWAHYDTGAAGENICLQATSMDLSAHQMGGFDKEKIRNLSNIPINFDILACMVVGKKLDESKLSKIQKDKEGQVRSRKKLKDIYFINEWK
ncbi:nitroreductase family protein [Methylophilaceae bacterium]|jgi:nitroreductase|nr:nitroreductase family protein [Methylophilaceae bacterium]|tara:strand:- start:3526 stop:4110 length:585 start_codon:yes stop_codon:yes gene_type:complete